MLKTLASILVLTLSLNVSALVDYSEVEGPRGTKKSLVKRSRPAIKRKAPIQPTRSKANSSSGNFELTTLYEKQQLSAESISGDLDKIIFKAHFQTNYNLYLDFSHWMASSDFTTLDQESSNSADQEQGRPEMVLGFNWLRFGKIEDMSTVDLYGGLVWEGSDNVASTRTDKIVGVETTKRFYVFALALGYEYQLTGDAKNPEETAIGDISILKTSFGWMVSGDINFVLEAGMVSVGDDSNLENQYRLSESQKFSYLRPVIDLGLTRSVSLELGGVFRTRKAQDVESLVGAKLWNIPGAYGNSLFAGLKLSI